MKWLILMILAGKYTFRYRALIKKYFWLPSLVLILTGCMEKRYPYFKISGQTQGTYYHLTYENSPVKDLKPQVDSLLKAFDMSLSTYVDSSLISRVNRGDTSVIIDPLFERVYLEAKEVWKKTDGMFDITVGPVVNAWGFGPGERKEVDSTLIDSLALLIGMDRVRIANNRLLKDQPGIKLDVNAIAQGYAVDVVADFLDNKGIDNYLVEIGGEIKTKGVNAIGDLWRVGIDKPIEGNLMPGKNLQVIISMKDRSLATSGNYRKFFEENGVKYVHSINPKTGYPVQRKLLSVTILANECITADAYATACMVMGLEKSIELVKNNKELDGYFIYNDEQGKYRVYHDNRLTPFLEEF
jgi:thiamine biosynthesis lipoprotein